MELWIRTQNRNELRKVNKLAIYPCDNWIIGSSIFDEYGKYKTKERALEVLDEIQKKMYNLSSCNYHNGYYSRLYEMPKE